ncbi:hypothetical protein [Brachybacterium paraconglomeratum]|uniref:hypothetical protein n=1 Tax=Brachybacterium paraconglomeratum TaxID=173362 RepID=UPI0002F3A109|nr:hypothetical protein [Brachybacterium paraconglomeratum]
MAAPAARRDRRPLVVLCLGLFGVAIVMLLLYGPFHGADYEAPGWYLHRFLASLMSSGAQASDLGVLHRLASWAMYGFVPLLIAMLVLVMAVLPAAVALGRRPRHDDAAGAGRQQDDLRADDARATRPGTTPRSEARDRDRLGSLVFSDDGSIGVAGAAPGEGLELGIAELRGLADEAGLPWHTRYETEGGARGFLEILRARRDGPTKVRRAAGTAAEAATATAATVTEVGESAPVERSDAVPSDPEASAPVGGEATVSSDPAASDHALWSPGDIGSVYTPTTLYSSGQGGEDASDDLSDDDGDREEGR